MTQIRPKEALNRAQDVPGYMTADELDWLINQARGLSSGAVWCELGCFVGRSLLAVGLSLPDGCGLISVDINWGSTTRRGLTAHDTFAEIAQGRNREISLHAVRDLTQTAHKFYPDHSLDVVFIDANHDAPGPQQDIAAWVKKIKPGGLLCGHDYCEMWPGVVQAVDEINFSPVCGTIWAGRV